MELKPTYDCPFHTFCPNNYLLKIMHNDMKKPGVKKQMVIMFACPTKNELATE